MNFDKITAFAEGLGCTVQLNAPMKRYTTFKTGGNAGVMITPTSDKALAEVIKCCAECEIKPLILGNGSNMLISDKGIDTVVINMCRENSELEYLGDGRIRCGAGVPLSRLCKFALENELTGLEFAYGIPGSAGGAAYMNAGAYGGEMKDVLESCRHIDADGNFGELRGKELGLGYRTSAYEKNGYTVTELYLKLEKGDASQIRGKMTDLLQRRKDKQPLDYPSAGSTFKRPEGYFAGQLIEECGLKGKSVGGAKVSEKHAGFVINTGSATSTDILELIDLVKATVLEQKGVELEPEVRLIGER